MKNLKFKIISFLIFLLAAPIGSFAGEKFLKSGVGYKAFSDNNHNINYHTGRYFYGGYGVTFGNTNKQTFQLQISNSNREVEYELPYVSASTSIDISHEYNFNIFNFKNSQHYLGTYFGNNFNLNFFPKIDRKNFIWQNFSSVGISSRNRYQINSIYKLDFNFQIPISTLMLLNRFDRFTGENPTNQPMIKDLAFTNRIFKPTSEIGLIFEKWGLNWGAYYQNEMNYYSNKNNRKILIQAHSLSLRLIY